MTASELEIGVEGGVLTGLDFGGHGPGVLLVHGSGHNAAAWTDVASRLVDRCHPIAVDLRGHGQNRLDSSDPEQYWRDLGAVLEACAWDRPVLVGHSTGGYAVAALTASGLATPAALCVVDGMVLDDRATALEQQAALRSAESVEQLQRIFRYGWRADDAELEHYVEQCLREADTDWLNAGARHGLVESVIRRSFVPATGGGMVGGIDTAQWVRRPTTEEIAAVTDVQPEAAVFPSRDLYDRIDCPMRIVLATDGFYAARRPEVEAIVALRPARRLTVVDANHNVPMTRPDQLADIILDVLADV
ncbi:MAG: alpha/beta hydrolase [Propionibacterium sp.]|nr:alpha/beta hydrolase [Propionibacterium sp.]